MIAPFAFLGSRYGAQLRDVFTNASPKEILEPRGDLAAIFGDALADNVPLLRPRRNT